MALILESTVIKLLVIYVYSLLSAFYVWASVRPLKSGLPRLAAGLPVVLGNLAVPLILDPNEEPLLITPIAGVLSLAAFKVLALCLGRGPLTLDFSVYQFLAVLLVPIVPYEAFAVSGGKRIPVTQGGGERDTWQLLRDYGKQMGCASVVALILGAYPDMHWFPRHWLYTLSSCMFLGGVFDALGVLATSMFGISVAPTFNRPWMSDCFADFWSRRWNLTTTYMMRVLVYEPVMEGRALATLGQHMPPQPKERQLNGSHAPDVKQEARKGFAHDPAVSDSPAESGTDDREQPVKVARIRRHSLLRRLLALQATFMFSGVWHILVFWYNTRVVSLRWALFFIIQAPIVLAESLLMKAWRKSGLPSLPHAVQVVAINAALIAVAGPLFFGPADETGFAQRNLAAVQPVVAFLKSHLFPASQTREVALLDASYTNSSSYSVPTHDMLHAAGLGMSSSLNASFTPASLQ